MFSFSQSAGGIGIFEYMANATLKLFHIVFILFFFYSDGNPIHNLGHTVRHLCQTYINVSQDPLVFHRLLLISVSVRKNFIRHQNQIPRLMGQTGNARKNFLLRPRFPAPDGSNISFAVRFDIHSSSTSLPGSSSTSFKFV